MKEQDKNIKESNKEETNKPSEIESSNKVDSPSVEVNDSETLSSDKKESNNNNSLELPFIIGTKVGMSQIFSSNGTVYPVTIIEAGPCTVTQIKTADSDGYNSIQLGYKDTSENKLSKPMIGHYKKANSTMKRFLKEFHYENSSDVNPGSEITLNQFKAGDLLNITGKSKGKGFAGHMKRHNFGGGRASHGKNSVMRKAGSIGAGTSPGRVWKGTRMAGRMGNDKVTIKNLELIKVDADRNLLYVSGAVPGPNKNIIYISRANYES